MKKFLLILSLLLFSFNAWAIPKPSEVEQAIKAGNTVQAEQMTREVVKEMPNSARAHYSLGQILELQNKHNEAYEELKKASELDKSLSFAKSPQKFRAIMSKVEINIGKADAPKVSNNPMSAKDFWWMLFNWTLIAGAGTLIFVFWNNRKKRKKKLKLRKEEMQKANEQLEIILKLKEEISNLDTEVKLSSHSKNSKSYLHNLIALSEGRSLQCIEELKKSNSPVYSSQVTNIKDSVNYIRYQLNKIPEKLDKDLKDKEKPIQSKQESKPKPTIKTEIKKEKTQETNHKQQSSEQPQPTIVEHHNQSDSGLGDIVTGILIGSLLSGDSNNQSHNNDKPEDNYDSGYEKEEEKTSYDAGAEDNSEYDSGNDESSNYDSGDNDNWN